MYRITTVKGSRAERERERQEDNDQYQGVSREQPAVSAWVFSESF